MRSVIFRKSLYPSRLPFVAISLNHFKRDALSAPSANPIGVRCPETEWAPDGSDDLGDGDALHQLLYQCGDISRPRRWCCYSTGLLVAAILEGIEDRFNCIVNGISAGNTVTVVDYGVGTGFATLELIKGLNEKGLLNQFEKSGIQFQLLVVDFPSGWFAKAYQLLHPYPFISFHSLKDKNTGKVRILSDFVSEGSVDLIYASMVFHLVPPQVLAVMLDGFADVLRNDGLLLWNTPDTAPTLPHSELIHVGNRKLRKFMLEFLDDAGRMDQFLSAVPDEVRQLHPHLSSQLAEIRLRLDPAMRNEARSLAEKQILPVPTDIGALENALAGRFEGDNWVKLSVMTEEELLALALLPANQRNVGEISDRKLRESLIRLTMTYKVLPELKQDPAGIPAGIILHWTFGKYIKRT